MIKIYIAGPITGIPDYEIPFNNAQKALEKAGFLVMNPAILPPGFEHEEYMQICFKMIDPCDAVLFLPGWEKSTGAKMELKYAAREDKHLYFDVGCLVEGLVLNPVAAVKKAFKDFKSFKDSSLKALTDKEFKEGPKLGTIEEKRP